MFYIGHILNTVGIILLIYGNLIELVFAQHEVLYAAFY